MRINQYTESDKCENKAGKSASLTLTQFRVNLLYRSSIAWLTTKTLIASPLKKQSTLLFASAICEGLENGERKQARGHKRAMLLSVVGACLSVTLLSASALAETCTASPDCQAMGYKESSCSDGGVKCPFGNYWFCGGKKDVCQNCEVGRILNSDMTCSVEKVSGKTPIGVVFSSGKAVALDDLSDHITWSNANSNSSSYSASGVTGWRLPTESELLTIYGNINSIQGGLIKAGATQFSSSWYWSSSESYFEGQYRVVNPVSGNSSNYSNYGNIYFYARPVRAFRN